MAADLWAHLPEAFDGLGREAAIRLSEQASKMLEHGGSVTLHFLTAGSSVLRTDANVFDDWCGVLKQIAPQGNAIHIAFLRATPKFFSKIAAVRLEGADDGSIKTAALKRVLRLIGEIAQTDAESALAAFRSSAGTLRSVSLDQFEEWIETGLAQLKDESVKARRSYFALETRQSNDQLQQTRSGLHLESVQHVLRLYIEALTGREVEIAPQSAMPQ